jgi:hypothetical protein
VTRDDLIDQLQASAAEHRAELERRESEREADPCAMQDHLLAEHAASEAIRSSPVSETASTGLVYKDYDNGALQSAATPDATASSEEPILEGTQKQWEDWLRSRLYNELRELTDAVKEDLQTMGASLHERETETAALKTEVAELKGKVDVLLNLVCKGGDIIDLPRGGWRRDRGA